MTANAVNGKPASKDPLFVGKEGITKDIDIITDNRIYDYIHDLGDFYVPERIRFRDDGEICIVNVRWGNSMTINAKLGRYLEKAQKDKSKFNIKQFGVDRVDTLANLFFKNIIESQEDLGIDIIKIGLSLDLSHSPVTSNSLNKF